MMCIEASMHTSRPSPLITTQSLMSLLNFGVHYFHFPRLLLRRRLRLRLLRRLRLRLLRRLRLRLLRRLRRRLLLRRLRRRLLLRRLRLICSRFSSLIIPNGSSMPGGLFTLRGYLREKEDRK
jgi:hypothetical protein